MGSETLITRVEELLNYYARYVGFLGDDEGMLETEAMAILTTRDMLAECWEQLSGDQREQVLATDDQLVTKHQLVAAALPAARDHDHRRWWWFLNEGPQVRQEAA